jgi:hypothetical protein
LAALSLGASFDLVSVANSSPSNPNNDSGWVIGGYGSLKATDKLTFNLRGEYFDLTGSPTIGGPIYGFPATDGLGEEVTITVQYALWANVTSRAEFRWDHIDGGDAFANNGADADAFLLAANLIYTF